MAGLEQFHSFVGKFVSLWQSGHNASLHVETKAGEAFVKLHVGLGQPLPPHQSPHHLKPSRPSRIRCRERRAAAHAENDAAQEATAAVKAAAQVATKEDTTAEQVVIEQATVAT